MTARRSPAVKPVDPLAGMRGAVQAARRQLGLDDDTYRAVLERLTGKTSSKDLNRIQLARVLDELRTKGFQPKVIAGGKAAARVSRPKPADHPSAKKARALWLSLWELGVVRDPSEQALESFAARQLKCTRLQWADQGHTDKLIEALKAMAERNNWSQDLAGVAANVRGAAAKKARQILHLKLMLICAQLAKLQAAGLLVDGDRASSPLVSEPTVEALTEEADLRIRRLGKKIREHDLVERLN